MYKGRKPSLSPEQVSTLRQRAASGEAKAAIARDLGISREMLYQYLGVAREEKRRANRPPSVSPV
nr:helix-turn-helix domain-containing protein [Burkholderia ambifaria]